MTKNKTKLTTMILLSLIFTLGCIMMAACGEKKTDTSDSKSGKVEEAQSALTGQSSQGNEDSSK
ncbi:hypothetical protein [Enterococcus sp. DIV0086]|uniref:hypothetical protein n=1 Tax=Enterococcus sp. DIV0086 TaxID=2774655 RepID=UPI003D2B7820